jgi:uncharacterized protein YdbL (DUF1318 family)
MTETVEPAMDVDALRRELAHYKQLAADRGAAQDELEKVTADRDSWKTIAQLNAASVQKHHAELDHYKRLAADRGAELELIEQERDNALYAAEGARF